MMNSSCNRLRASRWLSSRFVSLSGALLVLLLSGSAFAQTAPTANAGGPYGVDQGANVSLDGSGSSDTAGTNIGIVSYDWDLDGDSQYDDATGVSTTFNSADAGTFTIGLRVTDGDGETDTSTASVEVNNLLPTAEAGGPYSGNQGVNIPLNGSGSDPSGIVLYEWNLDGNGSFETVGQSPNFNSADAGTFTVVLRVTDNDGTAAEDTATVSVNGLPTADAGGPYSGNEGQTISLDGSGSSDADGTIDSYEWDFDTSDGADYTDATGVNPSFTLPASGSVTIGLRVTDDDGATATNTATVSISGLPTADAGGPYRGNGGDTINLDGSGSNDPGGTIVSYDWDFDTSNGSNYLDATGVNPSFTLPASGSVTIGLRVTDNDGATATDPTANAGSDQEVDEQTTVTLDGRASDDSDGSIPADGYAWTQTSGPSVGALANTARDGAGRRQSSDADL
jgi:hypothetical protein